MGWYMLKKRIIPIQLLNANRLCKTKQFNNPIDVGNPVKSSKIYSDQEADELILLNIDRDVRDIENLCKGKDSEIFVKYPYQVEAQIESFEDARNVYKISKDGSGTLKMKKSKQE